MPDDRGSPRLATVFARTFADAGGRCARGLQNRLRGVHRRPLEFALVRLRPRAQVVTANDSQDDLGLCLADGWKVRSQGLAAGVPQRFSEPRAVRATDWC